MNRYLLDPLSDKVFTVNDEIRITLLGKTGSGKSETGNTIIGRKAFISKTSAKSVTQECQIARAVRGDKQIILVDTPGLFDTTCSVDETKKEIAKCVTMSAPGVHCFLVVIDASRRFTEEETKAVNHILQMFGENSNRYLIVLFTRIDQLEEGLSEEEAFREYLNDIPEDLKSFLQTCDKRCLGFNNRASAQVKEVQAKKLFTMVEKMVRKNGGNCYTSKRYEEAERRIQEMINQRREDEIRQALKEKAELVQKIKEEQEMVHEQHLKEELRKMQQRHEDEQKRQEDSLRAQIRDQTQRNDQLTLGRILDFLVESISKTDW